MKPIFKIVLIAVGVLSLILIFVLIFFRGSEYAPKYSLISPKEYTDLFNDSAKEKTVLYVTNIIKGRNPISEYIYDDKYSVIIFKINVHSGATLGSLLEQGREQLDLSFAQNYSGFKTTLLDVYYACDTVQTADKIIISGYGDSFRRILKNDTISCGKIQMSKFILQYDRRLKADFKVGIRDFLTPRVPLETAFVQRTGGVFVVLITPIEKTNDLADDLPQTILNKNFFKK